MNKRTLASVITILGVIAGGVVVYRIATQQPAVVAKPDARPAGDDLITGEEERLAYVKEHIGVEGLNVGPDFKPGEDAGIVAGLVRVSGTVINKGTRSIDKLYVVINPQNAAGEVISSYRDEVLEGKRLAPNQSREFKFQIPENKEYAGKFLHSLQ